MAVQFSDILKATELLKKKTKLLRSCQRDTCQLEETHWPKTETIWASVRIITTVGWNTSNMFKSMS